MSIITEPIFEPKFINLEYVFYKIYVFLHKIFGLTYKGGESVDSNGNLSAIESTTNSSGGTTFNLLSDIFKFLLFFLILFLVTLIIYTIVRMFEIRKREHEYLHKEVHEYAHRRKSEQEKNTILENIKNPKWKNVLNYINSNNQSDWKLAIIEADSILDSLLNNLELKGDSVGDKLKSADKDKFKILNSVWEAHNMRNKIVHESAFELYHNEAKRIIGIYEEVFRSYNYI